MDVGWLQQIGFQNSEVSFVKGLYKKRALLWTNPSNLGSLAVATYIHLTEVSFAKEPYKLEGSFVNIP